MNIQVILTVTVLLTLALAAGVPTIASAPYLGNTGVGGETGANTLEEVLKIKNDQVRSTCWTPGDSFCRANLDSGSVGMLVVGTIFLSSIGTAFFIKGRSGKYAAIGRR